MTEGHEKIMAAARAGVLAAHHLGLPESNPEAGIEHDWEKQISRLEKAVAEETTARLEEAEENRQLRLVVISAAERVAWTFRGFVVLVVAVAAIGAWSYGQISDLARSNRQKGIDNQQSQVDAAVQARVVIGQSCMRLNRALQALRTIISRGDKNLDELYREGTITIDQLKRSKEAGRRARADLYSDDCKALARKIPVPSKKTKK